MPQAARGSETPLPAPLQEVEEKLAARLEEMMEARKELEADWGARVAALAARRGLTDSEMKAVLRGR